jgi:hypothetical protein
MAQLRSAPRWRFLISPRWLAWHVFAVVAFWGMCWLGDWQLHRALFGNSLSWAYTFEWPLFALTGAYFWAKTIRDEFQLRSDAPTAGASGPVGAEAATDTQGAPGVPVPAGRVPAAPAEPGGATARDAHLARLHQEVRRHGRWHGLR